MTAPNEELENMTPVEWLDSDGDADVVAKVADELGYE